MPLREELSSQQLSHKRIGIETGLYPLILTATFKLCDIVNKRPGKNEENSQKILKK